MGEGRRLDSRNEADFNTIYEKNFEILLKISCRIVADIEVAEDLVHDSFIKMSEKAMVFPSPDDAKFWLICVVRNASINFANRKKRERLSYEKVLRERPCEIATGETELLQKETQGKVQAALELLNENLRSVLILHEYADFNYREIARVLAISEGNVKVRMFRAREQLAKILEEDDVVMP